MTKQSVIQGSVSVVNRDGQIFVIVTGVRPEALVVGPAPDMAAAREYADQLAFAMAGEDGEAVVVVDSNWPDA